MTTPSRIDARGTRFGAIITSGLLLVNVFLALTGASTARVNDADTDGWIAFHPLADSNLVSTSTSWLLPTMTLSERLADPALPLSLLVAALFLWGVLSAHSHPWNVLFRRAVQPRLASVTETEDPRPPRFAQAVGLVVVGVGVVLHLVGVPWALAAASAAAFFAAFLNAAFGYCLGCQIYLLVQRFTLVTRGAQR